MTPAFKILANDVDATQAIRAHFVSGTMTDHEGLQSDSLELILNDAAEKIKLPPAGSVLNLFLGYRESGLVPKGLFVFDNDIELSGPPGQLILRATAAHIGNSETAKGFKAALKAHKTRSWHEQTLRSIIETIAPESGYEARVDASLGAEVIGHVDQTDESDLHFLTRLAKERNAVAKPAGGFLVFVPRGQSKSATGLSLKTIKLGKRELTSWKLSLAERGKYSAVRAYWQDLATGDRVAELAGAGTPIKTLRGNFKKPADAQCAAAAELLRISLGKAGATFVLPGRPDLAAEGRVEIDGLRTEFSKMWSITKAIHAFSDTGYNSTIECELPEEGK